MTVSKGLGELAPPGQRLGYDLLGRVGFASYHRYLQRREIQAWLAHRSIGLSNIWEVGKAP